MSETPSGRRRALLRVALNWAAVYSGWGVVSALAFVCIAQLRAAVLAAHLSLSLSRWSLGLVDQWGLFALGLVALVGILYALHYLVAGYPGGTDLGRFPRRLAGALAIEVAVLALAGLVERLAR